MTIRMKDSNAKSAYPDNASELIMIGSSLVEILQISFEIFHTSKNASPMFLESDLEINNTCWQIHDRNELYIVA